MVDTCPISVDACRPRQGGVRVGLSIIKVLLFGIRMYFNFVYFQVHDSRRVLQVRLDTLTQLILQDRT